MDSIAFSSANFSSPSVSEARFPSATASGGEGIDPAVDFAALLSSLASPATAETTENVPVVGAPPVEESSSAVPDGDQPEPEAAVTPLIVVVIPWAIPSSKLALDLSFVSANQEVPSSGDGGPAELPLDESKPPATNQVALGELSFTGRIAPAFERLDQPASDVDNSPAVPLSKSAQTATPVTLKAMVPEMAPIVTAAEPAEKFDRQSDEPALPASEAPQPVPVAAPASPAPAAGNQVTPASAISAPTSVPPPLHTESKDRTFQVRLGIEDTDVHLRIAERGGELHLAVSANTAEAAGRLREGLPDLMNALQSAGHNSEFWKAGPASSMSSSSREAGDQSFHDDSPSRKQQQQPDQDGGRRRKNRNKDYDPYGVASLA